MITPSKAALVELSDELNTNHFRGIWTDQQVYLWPESEAEHEDAQKFLAVNDGICFYAHIQGPYIQIYVSEWSSKNECEEQRRLQACPYIKRLLA